jgi:hypothetical protein
MALTNPDVWQGHLDRTKNDTKINEYMLIDGKVHRTHRVIAKRVQMGDVEDPDLMVAQPIYEWQQTDAGKFIMEKALEAPMWHRQHDPMTYGYSYIITAYLKDVDYTFWCLKWANDVK